MDINLIELWSNMGLPVRCVVFLLTIQAVACVGVTIDRAILLFTSVARSRQFAAEVQGPMQANDHASILQTIELMRTNHLSDYLKVGLETFLVFERREYLCLYTGQIFQAGKRQRV